MLLDRRRIEEPRKRVHVGEDRNGPRFDDGGDRRNGGARRGQNLVAGSDAGGAQGQMQRVGPGTDSDRMGRSEMVRELALEEISLFPQDEPGPSEHAVDPLPQLALQGAELGGEIADRDRRRFGLCGHSR